MAFTPEDLLPAGAVLAALSGAIASSFHARGLGYSHHRRAGPLAAASAFFMLAFLALEIYRAPGDWTARMSAVAQRPAMLLQASAVVAATALAWTASSWNRLADQGRLALPDPGHPLVATMAIGLGMVALIGLLLIAGEPFDVVYESAPASWPQLVAWLAGVVVAGLGLLVGAAATAHALTGRGEWADLALPWTRAAFLAAVVQLTVAASPPERTTLPTWLASLVLVPLIHGLIYYRKKRLMPFLTPFAGAIVLPAVLAALLATSANPVPPRISTLPLVLAATPAVAWLTARALASHGGRRWAIALVAGGLLGLAVAAIVRPELLARAGLEGHEMLVGGALAAALVGLILAWRSRSRMPPDETVLARWIQMATLVRLGMRLVAFALLALAALWSTGFLPSAPVGIAVAAVPVLLVMGVALSNQTLGRGTSLVVAVGAVATGLALSGTFGERGVWDGFTLFFVPVAGFALLGALLKLVSVSDTPSAPGLLRSTGAVLFLGGIVALAIWSDPGLIADLPGVAAPAAWWAPAGALLGLLAVAGGISAQRLRHHRLALAGSFALVLALPWVFPLGLAVAVVLGRSSASFEAGRSFRESPRGLGREFRKTGVYLIHVALALLALALVTGRLGWSGASLATIGIVLVLVAGGASFEAPSKGKTKPLGENR